MNYSYVFILLILISLLIQPNNKTFILQSLILFIHYIFIQLSLKDISLSIFSLLIFFLNIFIFYQEPYLIQFSSIIHVTIHIISKKLLFLLPIHSLFLSILLFKIFSMHLLEFFYESNPWIVLSQIQQFYFLIKIKQCVPKLRQFLI